MRRAFLRFSGNDAILFFIYMANETQPIILHPSKGRAVLLLLGSLAFVIVGLFLGSSGKWLGYLCSAFFALGIPVAISQMLPGASGEAPSVAEVRASPPIRGTSES